MHSANHYSVAASLAVGLAALAQPVAAQAADVDFHIPRQSLPAAMAEFSRQSGFQILFPYDQLKNVRTRAVDGRMSADQAVAAMIQGTGIRAARAGQHSFALSVAKVEAAPASAEVRPVALVTEGAATMAAYQGAASVAPADSASPTPIVVTGTRGQPRTITASPTPIDVISGEELEKTGKPGVLSALNTLVPSFNVPTRAGGGTSTVISTGGLRGLNPDQMLVLVNGKRRHKTSLINAVSSLYNGSVPTDLDMIPTSAVDHIEVLRDGAAAQYGSDAIAGVINIILRKDRGKGSAAFTAGQNMDRSDGENFLGEASYGVALGDKGFVDFFVNAKKSSASNRAIPIDSSVQLYNKVNGALDPREATADRLVTKNYGAFPVQAINLGYNTSYTTPGGIEVYSYGTYGLRRSQLDFTFRTPANAASLPELYPNGFRPSMYINEQDLEVQLGAKGGFDGWKWDLSTNYGKNRSWQNAFNTLNPSLGPTSPTTFYVGTLISSEWDNAFDITKGYKIGGGNLQVSAGLAHRRESYAVQQGDPNSYAAGTYTYVVNGTTVRPAPGGQAAAGFTPADAGYKSRNNLSAYLDVTYDPSVHTTVDLAARFEHFDDSSGNAVIGKATVRQEITPWLALRGAINNGFRAPSVAQQLYASTTGQFRTVNGALNLLQIKTLPVDSAAAIALGAKPLRPERSLNLSGGFVLKPLRGFNITVDAYQIQVNNRIALTSTLTGTAVSTILVANGLSGDVSAQYYANAINTRTRGVDVVATWRNSLLNNQIKLNWNIGYNYNETIINGIAANPSQLAALGSSYVLFDRLSQSNMTDNMPKSKLFLNNVASYGNVSLSTRVVRYGGFWSKQNATSTVSGVPVYANDRYFGGKFITDMELSWQANKAINLAVGANNLFNVYPDANGVYNAALGSGQYPTTGAFGFTGGYYYGRVRVNF
jgi:iron complex outermembrane receptor protein